MRSGSAIRPSQVASPKFLGPLLTPTIVYGLTSGDYIRFRNTGVSWGQPRPAYQGGGLQICGFPCDVDGPNFA